MTMLPMKRDPMQQASPIPRRGGLFGSSAPQQAMPVAASGEPAPKKKFDWLKLVGVLGDGFAMASGGQPHFTANLVGERNRRQAQEYAEQTYQRRRGDEWSDWERQQQWQRDNPKPQAPTNYEQILDAAGLQGEERIRLLRMKAQNEAQGVPMAVDITNPDGSVGRQYIRPGSLGAPMQAPAAPIGKLKPYGGQTATPSGGFR